MQQPRAELVLQRRIPVPAKVAAVGPLEAQLCIAARESESENVSVRCVRASRQSMNGTHQHQPRDELDREPLARRLRRHPHRVVEHRVEDALLPLPFRVVRARTRSAADQRPYGGQKRTVRRGRDWRAELRGRRRLATQAPRDVLRHARGVRGGFRLRACRGHAARLALLRGPGGWRFCARVRREGRELAKDEVELLEEWLELRSSSISKDPGS